MLLFDHLSKKLASSFYLHLNKFLSFIENYITYVQIIFHLKFSHHKIFSLVHRSRSTPQSQYTAVAWVTFENGITLIPYYVQIECKRQSSSSYLQVRVTYYYHLSACRYKFYFEAKGLGLLSSIGNEELGKFIFRCYNSTIIRLWLSCNYHW